MPATAKHVASTDASASIMSPRDLELSMAITSSARTTWNGTLTEGSGHTTLDSGVANFAVNWRARSEGQESVSSPEELLAAAHASCFSMALSHGLTGAGTPPESINSSAKVTFQAGRGITGIELSVSAKVPGLDQEGFAKAAADAKAGCPVSQALAGVTITLAAAELLS